MDYGYKTEVNIDKILLMKHCGKLPTPKWFSEKRVYIYVEAAQTIDMHSQNYISLKIFGSYPNSTIFPKMDFN